MVEEIVYLCPKCTSKKWKFPGPLKLSTDMMERSEKGEKILECRDCGFVGVFLKIQKDIN
jgi:DNA-directed RNA polymerase subunit RPC12/RpoP